MTNAQRFVEDMENADLSIYSNYMGRNFYKGPGVIVDSIQEALAATRIPCQWDNMGKQFIVYPQYPDIDYNDVEIEEKTFADGYDCVEGTENPHPEGTKAHRIWQYGYDLGSVINQQEENDDHADECNGRLEAGTYKDLQHLAAW